MSGGRRRKTAAALRYDTEKEGAPRVVASGRGEQAEQIVEIAKEHHIPVHADPQLAELLAALDIGACIPEELYRIVAEVLVFVYEMDKGFSGESATPPVEEAPPRSAAVAPSGRGAAEASPNRPGEGA